MHCTQDCTGVCVRTGTAAWSELHGVCVSMRLCLCVRVCVCVGTGN